MGQQPRGERDGRRASRPWLRVCLRTLVLAGSAGAVWLLGSASAHADAGDASTAVPVEQVQSGGDAIHAGRYGAPPASSFRTGHPGVTGQVTPRDAVVPTQHNGALGALTGVVTSTLGHLAKPATEVVGVLATPVTGVVDTVEPPATGALGGLAAPVTGAVRPAVDRSGSDNLPVTTLVRRPAAPRGERAHRVPVPAQLFGLPALFRVASTGTTGDELVRNTADPRSAVPTLPGPAPLPAYPGPGLLTTAGATGTSLPAPEAGAGTALGGHTVRDPGTARALLVTAVAGLPRERVADPAVSPD